LVHPEGFIICPDPQVSTWGGQVDIVVKGRNVEVPDHYRVHVAEKLHKIERYDHTLIRIDVELSHERNPRQSDHCQRVELTCACRGPVVRAEACASDFYTALDTAAAKLDTRLRRAADRRRVHRGRRSPVSVAEATGWLTADGVPVSGVPAVGGPCVGVPAAARDVAVNGRSADGLSVVGRSAVNGRAFAGAGRATSGANGHAGPALAVADRAVADRAVADRAVEEPDDDQPWHIVRSKEHHAAPMTVEEALLNMELVGHDFYLFVDKDSRRPSVVYRRRAYDYAVISVCDPSEPDVPVDGSNA
jgi:ribosomal subunit interface protein